MPIRHKVHLSFLLTGFFLAACGEDLRDGHPLPSPPAAPPASSAPNAPGALQPEPQADAFRGNNAEVQALDIGKDLKKEPRSIAVAIRGAVIVKQTWNMVTYRSKCEACGTVQPGSATFVASPPPSTLTTSFLCPKCRKMQNVAIQGGG